MGAYEISADELLDGKEGKAKEQGISEMQELWLDL